MIGNKINNLVNKKVSFFLFFSDIISISLSFFLAILLSNFLQNLSGIYSYTKINHDYLSLIICPVMLILFYIKGHYTRRNPWWEQVRYIFGLCLIAFIGDVFIRLILQLQLADFYIAVSSIFIFFFILLGRQINYFFFNKLNLWKIDTIIIGSADAVTDTLYAFNADPYTGYNIKKIFLRNYNSKTVDIESLPKRYKDIEILNDNMSTNDFIKNNINHFFVISIDTYQGQERQNLINDLTNMNIIYSVAPPITSMNLFEMRPQNFFGYDIMLLHSKNIIFSPVKHFTKRSMDILGAMSALIFFSPVFLIVLILLKFEGQVGTVFYGGERIGKGGKLFKCWKFRSMEPNSDYLLDKLFEQDPHAKTQWEKYRKIKGKDPRITTKTANIIRKTSIDELPQFWNVLIGDMSLVGPRPILQDESILMGDSFQNYIKVRPGLTGLWQVSGRNNTTFERRITMDNWYVRNWSIWGDIVIMLKTLNVVIKGSGSY